MRTTAPRPGAARRATRALALGASVLVLLVAIALPAGLALLCSDRGRGMIVGAAAEQGLALDYQRLELRPLDGRLALEGLRFPSPPPFVPVAPDWLTVERLELGWSVAALLEGRLELDAITIEGVRAHVVVDEEGRDSVTLALEALLGTDDEPADDEPAPLSRTLVDLELPMGLRIGALAVRDVRAELTQQLAPDHVRHTVLDGLELEGALRGGRPLDLALALRSPARDEGTRVVITERHAGDERVQEVTQRLEVRATTGDDAVVSLDASSTLISQRLEGAPALPSALLAASAVVRFAPERGATRVEVERLSVLDDAARVAVAMELPDGAPWPRLERGEVSIHLDPLVALLPAELGVRVEEGRAELALTPGEGDAVQVALRGGVARVEAAGAAVEGVQLELDGTLAPASASLRARVPVARVSVDAGGGQVLLEGAELTLAAPALALREGDAAPTLASLRGDVEAALSTPRIVASAPGSEVTVDGARLDLQVPLREQPTIDPAITLALGAVDARMDGTRARLAPARIELTARGLDPAAAPPLRVAGAATLPRVEVTTAARARLTAQQLALSIDADVRSAAELASVSLGLRAATLHAVAPGRSVDARAPELRVSLDDVRIADVPAESVAAVSIRLSTPHLAARDGDARYTVDPLRLAVRGGYAGRAPSALSGTLTTGAVRGAEGDGPMATLLAPGELELSVRDLSVDADAPLRSRAVVRAQGHFAPVRFEAEASLRDGDGQGTLHARAEPARALAALLALPDDVDLSRASVEASARGAWRGLAGEAPAMEHHAELTVRRASVARPGLELDLPRTRAVVSHEGRAAHHRATVAVVVDPPTLDGTLLDRAFTLDARVTLDGLDARIETTGAGPGGLDLRGTADAVLAPGEVRHTERLSLSGLGVLGDMIPTAIRDAHPVDVGAITLELTGEGSVASGDEPALRQGMRATVRGLRYHPEAISIASPEARIELDLERRGEGVGATVRIAHDRVEIEDPVHHHLVIHGLEETVRLRSSAPGVVSVEVDGRIERIEHDFFTAYPMEDLTLSARLAINGAQTLELERFVMENRRGGTHLELTKTISRARRGGAEEGGARGGDRLLLRGRLTQDLARIDATPERFRGRGRVTMPLTLESGDGSLFRLHATMQLDGVDVEMPEMALELRGVRAVVPLEEAFEWTPEAGLVVVANTERNPFARVRFQDVQPFLGERSHLDVERFRWGPLDAGPIHGSLQIDRNVFSIDALHVERGEALITGQLRFDYLAGAERLEFRGNVTNLRLDGDDQPLDANAAIVLDPERLEVDGRVQIVRIGSAHLQRLIDMLDPYHENPSLGSLRGALDLGHPQRVGIGLHEGLMSMRVELGGLLGSLLQIGEIQGIALGPFMTRHVAPHLPASE